MKTILLIECLVSAVLGMRRLPKCITYMGNYYYSCVYRDADGWKAEYIRLAKEGENAAILFGETASTEYLAYLKMSLVLWKMRRIIGVE